MTIRQVKLIEKIEFADVTFDPEYETFVIHVAALNVDPSDKIHLSKRAQIAYLKADETPTKVPSEYTDFTDVFSPKLAAKLSKHMKINDYAIKLIDDWKPSYDSIYSISFVKSKILKAYIKNNLANSFIRLSKFLAKAFIFFDKKSDGSLRLYVNY